MFKQNVHSIERVVRILAGLGLISLAFVGPKNLWFALPGGIILFTGLAGWCPPYALLGINTCKLGSKKTEEAPGPTSES